jgi:hypothetical protein
MKTIIGFPFLQGGQDNKIVAQSTALHLAGHHHLGIVIAVVSAMISRGNGSISKKCSLSP